MRQSGVGFPIKQRGLLLRAVWVAWLCLVTIGSLLPSSSPLLALFDRAGVSDKALHFSSYFLAALLPVLGLSTRRRGLIAACLMAVLGLALEAAQDIVVGRTVEVGDVIANQLGVLCGMLVGLGFRP